MIIRSPYPDVSIPEVPLTPFVLQKARDRGDKVALIEGPTGRVLSYAQLADNISHVAASLARRGFKKGQVFGILSPNIPEYAVAFHAVALLGGIVTPLNPLYTDHETAHQLKDAGARFLVTVPACLEKATEAAHEAGIEEVFVFGECDGATPFDSLLEGDPSFDEVEINAREDIIVLPYSSGTTGLPKGVMLTHYNLVSNLRQMEALNYFFDTDTLICVLPLFHIYGLVVVLNMGLYTGATIVTMPRFDLEGFLQAAQDYEVSLAHLVPPIVLSLSKNPIVDNYKLPKLKMIFSGAAPLGEDLTRSCMTRLEIKFGSIGVCAPNTECKILSLETGDLLGPNEMGEVCVRGPQVMKGYLNCPEATSQTVDEEGWLHTGDIGYADEEGHFFIVDRAKELIKYKGLQVPPAELEAILLTHPAIVDAAVIPCPDDEAGEVPKALVVLRQEASAEEILDFVAGRVAPFKRIRYLEFIDKIPKSPSGKILRRVLVERERAKNASIDQVGTNP